MSEKLKEKVIEKRLVEEVKKLNGLIYKFNSQGNNGVPDRLIVFPKNLIFFVELKKPGGGILSKVQEYQLELLREKGCKTFVISNITELLLFKNVVEVLLNV